MFTLIGGSEGRRCYRLQRGERAKKIGGKGFNLVRYVWGVALEHREALKGLIEENMSE